MPRSMLDETADQSSSSQNNLRRRRITLAGGRYMIFYTFDGESASRPASGDGGGNAVGSEERNVKPEASEERRV